MSWHPGEPGREPNDMYHDVTIIEVAEGYVDYSIDTCEDDDVWWLHSMASYRTTIQSRQDERVESQWRNSSTWPKRRVAEWWTTWLAISSALLSTLRPYRALPRCFRYCLTGMSLDRWISYTWYCPHQRVPPCIHIQSALNGVSARCSLISVAHAWIFVQGTRRTQAADISRSARWPDER